MNEKDLARSKRKLKSLVSSRFGLQLPILVLFLIFAVAVGSFLFREISADRFRIMRGADPIYFESNRVDGLGFGSDLVCQGLTVGNVRVVKVLEQAGGGATFETVEKGGESLRRLRFRVEAILEEQYSKWTFKELAVVKRGVGPAYLGLASIELQIDQIVEGERPPQTLKLRFEDGAKLGEIQDDFSLVLKSLTRTPEELEARIEAGEASSVETTLLNVNRVTKRLDSAIAYLAEGEESPLVELVATIQHLKELVKKLDQQIESLGDQASEAVENSNEAITLAKSAIVSLTKTVDDVEKSALQVLGETTGQRRKFRSELMETIENARKATATLNDILPRVGDTGLGRMLIRKDDAEEHKKKEAEGSSRR